MRRRFFTFVSAVSLLLCVATAILWERSHRYAEYIYYDAGSEETSDFYGVLQWRGRIQVERLRNGDAGWPDEEHTRNGRWYFGRSPLAAQPGRLGIVLRWIFETGTIGTPKRHVFNENLALLIDYGTENFPELASPTRPGPSATFFIVSHALVVTVTVLPPAIWAIGLVRRIRRRRREARKGHCLTCDYDLRATPSYCPECGTIPIGVKAVA
jgi:hypothetical protein